MIIKSKTELLQALDKFSSGSVVALDTETTGLNVRADRVIGLGLHDGTTSFYVNNDDLISTALEAVRDMRLIAFNAYFDLEMIKNNFNIDLWSSLHADVLCLKHTVKEEPPFKLKDIAKDEFGHDSTKEQEELKASIKANGGKPNEFYKADEHILAKYCIQDCNLTIKLFNLYSDMLEKEGLQKFFYEDEVMPLYKEVTRFMQSGGIQIDKNKCNKLLREISLKLRQIKGSVLRSIKPYVKIIEREKVEKSFKPSRKGKFAQFLIEATRLPVSRTKAGKFSISRSALEPYKIYAYIGYILGNNDLTEEQINKLKEVYVESATPPFEFNIQSRPQLSKLFFEVLKETPLSWTKKNKAPQVDDDFLESVAHKYNWVRQLQNYNKLLKLKSTYIERFLEESENGIFYPSFMQHRTVSGRYGSNLQQLPRPADPGDFDEVVLNYRNKIRELFIAGPGHKFIDADYESLEPHIFAHVSNEDKIRNIFNLNHDFYSTIAIDVGGLKGVSADKKADNYLGKENASARQQAKAYSLGIPYGMESFALSKAIDISQNRAEILISNFKSAYKNLHEWMKKSEQDVIDRGFVVSQAGRKRRFQEAQKLLKTYGFKITDSLYLYEIYREDETVYNTMKELRRTVKKALNNAKNFQIQSFAASITNRACIQINRKMKEFGITGHVVAQIHDQIIVKCSELYAKQVQKIVQESMESSFADVLSVKLKAPAKIGNNFADAH